MGDTPDLAFIAQIEERADELLRAAAALYLDGPSFQGRSPSMRTEILPCGMFEYLIVVRQERLYITHVTPWPL
ncbi:hypothetical protein ADK38_06435 [Streptomyces varsoviensis]|uniref:Uncharacterized protein n=1 Tax=Streptomyces varsoviensis TaxID=67373 RepID=A0ABR5JBL4_9ACTN|nr:hypothetical protein ADK38_06435 [Streptomyces varsoviensis]